MSINIFSPSGSYTSPSITNLLGNGQGGTIDSYLFSHRIPITIHGNESASAADYQMKLQIFNSTGTNVTGVHSSSAAPSIYCGASSFSSSAFADLRFGIAGATTGLPYWIESSSASVSAVVWVKLPAIPASASADTTIYMYYGNAGASAASSDTSTFISIDTLLVGRDVTGTPGGYGGKNTVVVDKYQSAYAGVMRYFKTKANNAAPTKLGLYSHSSTVPGTLLVSISGDSAVGIASITCTPTTLSGSTYYWIGDICNSSDNPLSNGIGYTAPGAGLRHYKVGVTYSTYSFSSSWDDTGYTEDTYAMFVGGYGNRRNYTANEPTWSSFGAEEGNSFTFTSQTSNIIIGDEVSE